MHSAECVAAQLGRTCLGIRGTFGSMVYRCAGGQASNGMARNIRRDTCLNI